MRTFGMQVVFSIAIATGLYFSATRYGEWLLAVLFYTYFALGLLLALGNLRTYRNLASDRAGDGFIKTVAQEYAKVADKSIFVRLRENTAEWMQLISTSILWPAAQLKGFILGFKQAMDQNYRRFSILQFGAQFKLDGFDVPCALLSFAVVVAIAVAHFENGLTSIYGEYIVYSCVGTMGLRHLEYIVTPGGLHQRLKRASGDPHVFFLVVTLSDFIALVVAYTTLRNWNSGASLNWDLVRSTVEDLGGSIGAAKELWMNPEAWREVLSPSVETASNLSGLLLTTALVKILVEFKNFAREADDYLHLALAYAQVGSFREGLKWANRAQVTPSTLIAKSVLLTGAGDVSGGVEAMKHALADLKQDTPNALSANLLTMVSMFPVPRSSISALLRELSGQLVGDAALSHVVTGLLATDRISDAEATDALKAHKAEDYPLTFASIYFMSERAAIAYALLAGALPQTEIGDIVRRLGLFDVGIVANAPSDEDARQIANAWLADHSAIVTQLVGSLKTDIEKTMILARLLRPVAIARQLGGTIQVFLDNLRMGLRVDLERNPVNEPMLNIEAQGLNHILAG